MGRSFQEQISCQIVDVTKPWRATPGGRRTMNTDWMVPFHENTEFITYHSNSRQNALNTKWCKIPPPSHRGPPSSLVIKIKKVFSRHISMSFDLNVFYSSCWGYSLINTLKLKQKWPRKTHLMRRNITTDGKASPTQARQSSACPAIHIHYLLLLKPNHTSCMDWTCKKQHRQWQDTI